MTIDFVRFKADVERARREALGKIDQVPISALIWGPNPTASDLVAVTRVKLRDELRTRGHYAEFSEDLIDSASQRGPFAQQLAQAEAFDIVFALPASYGSVAELHDFARIPGLSHKLLAYMDEAHASGYSGLSLMQAQTSASCKLELYDAADLPDGVISRALDQVFRMQEIMFLAGRR